MNSGRSQNLGQVCAITKSKYVGFIQQLCESQSSDEAIVA